MFVYTSRPGGLQIQPPSSYYQQGGQTMQQPAPLQQTGFFPQQQPSSSLQVQRLYHKLWNM